MKLKNILLSTLILISLLTSCSGAMTPNQVNYTLPTLTTTSFYSQTQTSEAIINQKCKFLVKGRTYAAPIGFTAKNDLKNAARGIDEWVKLDGGNAYVLTNYKWVTIADSGTSQLHVYFDTMQCD